MPSSNSWIESDSSSESRYPFSINSARNLLIYILPPFTESAKNANIHNGDTCTVAIPIPSIALPSSLRLA